LPWFAAREARQETSIRGALRPRPCCCRCASVVISTRARQWSRAASAPTPVFFTPEGRGKVGARRLVVFILGLLSLVPLSHRATPLASREGHEAPSVGSSSLPRPPRFRSVPQLHFPGISTWMLCPPSPSSVVFLGRMHSKRGKIRIKQYYPVCSAVQKGTRSSRPNFRHKHQHQTYAPQRTTGPRLLKKRKTDPMLP